MRAPTLRQTSGRHGRCGLDGRSLGPWLVRGDRDGTCARLGPATTTVLWLARGDSPPWGRAGEGGRPSSWPRRVAAGVGRVQPGQVCPSPAESTHARTHRVRLPAGSLALWLWAVPYVATAATRVGSLRCWCCQLSRARRPCYCCSSSLRVASHFHQLFCSILQICQLRPLVPNSKCPCLQFKVKPEEKPCATAKCLVRANPAQPTAPTLSSGPVSDARLVKQQ